MAATKDFVNLSTREGLYYLIDFLYSTGPADFAQDDDELAENTVSPLPPPLSSSKPPAKKTSQVEPTSSKEKKKVKIVDPKTSAIGEEDIVNIIDNYSTDNLNAFQGVEEKIAGRYLGKNNGKTAVRLVNSILQPTIFGGRTN